MAGFDAWNVFVWTFKGFNKNKKLGRLSMGAKYSYGVWERFARQANSILRGFNKFKTHMYIGEYMWKYILSHMAVQAKWQHGKWAYGHYKTHITNILWIFPAHPTPPLPRGVGLVAVVVVVEKTRSWDVEHAKVSKCVNMNENLRDSSPGFWNLELRYYGL